MNEDAENLMREFVVAAMNSPERLFDLLDSVDDLECARRVIEHFSFTFGGWIQDKVEDESVHQSAPRCICKHPAPAEATAMRIVLAYKVATSGGDDGQMLRHALVEAARCPSCCAGVLAAQAGAQVAMLDGTGQAWRHDMEKHLLALLDENA